MLQPIPQFQSHEIKTANDCAIMQWNGYDYVTGKQVVGDYELLDVFSRELIRSTSVSPQAPSFSQQDIRSLIRVCRMKATYLHQKSLDFPNMESLLFNCYPAILGTSLAAIPAGDSLPAVTHFMLDASKSLVKPGIFHPGAHRVALASRLLFFAAPDLLIFNYSRPLATKAMGFGTVPAKAYPNFADTMLAGLRDNWTELERYNIPLDTSGNQLSNILSAYNTHWWTRRLLDIALLIHFKVFKPYRARIRMVRNCTYKNQNQTTVPCP